MKVMKKTRTLKSMKNKPKPKTKMIGKIIKPKKKMKTKRSY